MTNNPGTWWQGIATLCRWGLAWLSIGLFTFLAGINLLRTAFMERILLVAQCISGGMGAAQWRGGPEWDGGA